MVTHFNVENMHSVLVITFNYVSFCVLANFADTDRKLKLLYLFYAKCSLQARWLEEFIHQRHTEPWKGQIWHTQSPQQGKRETSCHLQICLRAGNGNTSPQHCYRQHWQLHIKTSILCIYFIFINSKTDTDVRMLYLKGIQ